MASLAIQKPKVYTRQYREVQFYKNPTKKEGEWISTLAIVDESFLCITPGCNRVLRQTQKFFCSHTCRQIYKNK